MYTDRLTLESQHDMLEFDSETLSLTSFRSKMAAEQEFISAAIGLPVFAMGYLDTRQRYRLLTSHQADNVQVSEDAAGDQHQLRAAYGDIGGYDLRVTCQITASDRDPFIRWKIGIENNAGLRVVDVQYPYIVCRFDLEGAPGSEAILLPHGYGSGRLIEKPGEAVPSGGAWKQKLAPDSSRAWEFCSRTGDANHYPGMQFAQFLAYYNDRAGLYLACQDTAANVKRFAALHHQAGLRLGVAHVGDWPQHGDRMIEYDTVTRGFQGDWYDAADLYREWTSQQKWFIPLVKRQDIPSWLIDSPVYITLRPQGVLDAGPVSPVSEFLPYEKCIPILEQVSAAVDAPLAVILMGWEHGGSWVYPDALPPIGGETSMHDFITSIRAHGWHAGSFCSGTRWVIRQFWNTYDGRDYFEQHGGEKSVCREADGAAWLESWDMDWRPSYACCLGAPMTRQVAQDYVQHLIDWGMQSIQFLDQNNGSSTFPCFAADHEHPPAPGKWMAEKMAQFMTSLHASAREAGAVGVAHSAESGLNEYCLPLFQQTELRTYPPHYGVDIVPLYQYLFHECVVLQGMMGNAPEPYHLVIRNAVNCVLGGIPGGVLTGDGTLLDKDTNNWAPWQPHVENSAHAFQMIRAVSALRRGPGKDFLVYGRMLRPVQANGIPMVEWHYNGRLNRIPAVFHSAWQAQDGRTAIVLANWTTDSQTVVIEDDRLRIGHDALTLQVSDAELHNVALAQTDQTMTVTLPALSCALLS
ncbi:MAG: DUF6259 domain-containing protein [Chloroflexi bacterium]|nr:DUF6259 domain-containing protein [Chloroflexota bacterium]MCL5275376.1 DUF6259 domain-containing protein [Chloroflexota bacterium]